MTELSNTESVLARINKQAGEAIAHKGVKVTDVERIPTGIFALDLATGGGFPRNRINMVYGTEGSGKTTLAYLAGAQVQRGGQKVVFVDVEGTFDAAWASMCGFDPEEMILVSPETAEQAVDVIQAFSYAKDVGLLVVDSIAALSPSNELESEASKAIVGGSAMLVGKMCRKVGDGLRINKEITALFINQIRYKIGVMYGDPETFPGGQALRFAMSMNIRLNAKDKFDKSVTDKLPVFRTTTGTIRKWKVPIYSKAFEYDMCVYPHKTYTVGSSPSWPTVSGLLKQGNVITKEKTKWQVLGEEFPTLGAIQERYDTDHDFMMRLQAAATEVGSKQMIIHDDQMGVVMVDKETGEIIK